MNPYIEALLSELLEWACAEPDRQLMIGGDGRVLEVTITTTSPCMLAHSHAVERSSLLSMRSPEVFGRNDARLMVQAIEARR